MEAKTLKCTSVSILGKELGEFARNNFNPSFAIAFCSVRMNLDQVIQTFNAHRIDLIGCTTAGEIINDQLLEGELVVLLISIHPNNYRLKLFEYSKKGEYQAAMELGQFAVKSFTNPAIMVLSGGLTIDAEKIVSGIKAGSNESICIAGGLAGDDLQLKDSWVFTNDGKSNHGLVGLIFDKDKITIENLAISGWEPIGGENIITKSDGNVVHSINGERAYDVFIKYFGFLEDNMSKSDQLITIQTNYPLNFLKKDGKSVLRSPIFVDKDDGTITLAASVNEGDRFRFSYSPGFEIIDQTIKEFQYLQKKVPDTDAVILFSCKGRHGAFGPLIKREIEALYRYWKKPLIGLLTYGEFGNTGSGISEFHNETCSVALIKEN